VFDPFGDGEPENDRQVPQSYDGNPTTAWKTLDYRGSADFGNLKPGVGVVYDLGGPQALTGVTLATTLPGSAVEVRVGDSPDGDLDSFRVVSSTDALTSGTPLTFDQPVTARYVLVWVTSLVEGPQGYTADLSEVSFTAAS
jgi:hypothetical protein